MSFVNYILLLPIIIVVAFSSSGFMVLGEEIPLYGPAVLLRVDQSGKGDFTKIQDAINAVPSNNNELVFILVKPGIYKEKIVVPADKPYITISGTKPSLTIITWNDGGDIFDSPTFSVLASDFVARFLTIENTFGSSGKAVALRVSGDKAAFYGCRIVSFQDTLLDDTAQRRQSPSEETGFVFLGCNISGVRTAFTVYYGQYKCYGRGAVMSKRVEYGRNLTSLEAEPFLTKDFIGAKAWIRPVPTKFTKAFNKLVNGAKN
ncbi:hypothetical protein G4B88_002956 [Cannabis sativa]|uniref:pectinesterase n=1 Tax=Cannabis sativa TaxID=3483 RepID=A0A7J6FK78_CANSA|nr:hypothetical protein G4B88_002956 [Cannabis sativa]